jgi:DNA adenine methylase
MILRIASDLENHFPQHKIYVEPFFGAGGMFFNKRKAKFNFLNDIDEDVFNLFNVVNRHYDDFVLKFETMPIHEILMNYWKQNKETDNVLKALRFIFLSNFTLFGKGDTLRVGSSNSKDAIYENLQKVNKFIFDVQFANSDFRRFLKMYSFKENELENTFIYADPPYLDTEDNYSHSFKEQDSVDLFDCLIETGCKFAYSEFNNPFILEQAEKKGLNVTTIGERQNIKNRRIEVLVTNYKKPLSLF